MDDIVYYSGQFLLAMPGMGDPRFNRSIIALCSHDENGALGINLGEVSHEISFHGILQQFNIDTNGVADRPVYAGGPVEQQRGFIIHSLDYNLSDTIQVGNRWGLSSSLDILHMIAKGKGPKHWIAALGYSGWAPNQLENELTQNGWAVAPGDPKWLYGNETNRWQSAWDAQGIDVAKLSGQFGSA